MGQFPLRILGRRSEVADLRDAAFAAGTRVDPRASSARAVMLRSCSNVRSQSNRLSPRRLRARGRNWAGFAMTGRSTTTSLLSPGACCTAWFAFQGRRRWDALVRGAGWDAAVSVDPAARSVRSLRGRRGRASLFRGKTRCCSRFDDQPSASRCAPEEGLERTVGPKAEQTSWFASGWLAGAVFLGFHAEERRPRGPGALVGAKAVRCLEAT